MDKFVAEAGDKWLPVWIAKFKVAPPGERWADQRFAEFMARWMASNGEKFVKFVDFLKIKPVVEDEQ